MEHLKKCWEIKDCGRAKGGAKVASLGECIASSEGLGHSCWAIAGTLCGGEVQGSVAQKEGNCMNCDVYHMYHRLVGKYGAEIQNVFPEEHAKYTKLMISRIRSK